MTTEYIYTIKVRDEGPDGYWAEVVELPGCFASGDSLDELQEALTEAIGLWLSTEEYPISVVPETATPGLLAESRQRYIVNSVG